jgi:hypothetical protein
MADCRIDHEHTDCEEDNVDDGYERTFVRRSNRSGRHTFLVRELTRWQRDRRFGLVA